MKAFARLPIPFGRRAICILLLASIATPASASLITFGFQGTVNNVDSELSSSFSVGDDWSGFYTFDSNASFYSSGPSQRVYDAVVLGGSRVGSYLGGFIGGGDIVVGNDTTFGYDLYSVRVGPGSGGSRGNIFGHSVNGYELVGFEINLFDWDSLAFDSMALPLVPPRLDDFAGFTYSSMRLLFQRPGEAISPQITVFNWAGTGRLYNLTETGVLEPATLALCGLGLAGLGFARRRKA